MNPKIDEPLWEEIQAIIPSKHPGAPALLGKIDKGIKVWLVDGDDVKIEHDMDFVEGGNGLEDPELCERDEIYLDDNISLHDLAFICYHEAVERRDMLKGMSYEKAHERANAAEKQLRIRARESSR